MKKSIFLFSTLLSSIGILTFGCMSFVESNDPKAVDFKFRIESRDMATITQEDLQRATTAMDILPKTTNWPANPVRSLRVMTYKNHIEFSELGKDLNLNDAQKRLLGTLE